MKLFTILLLITSFLSAEGADRYKYVPSIPTIFFLSRVYSPYFNSPPDEQPTLENARRIVSAAAHELGLKPYPSMTWENVIILDEDACWFVSFHARGNGNLQAVSIAGDEKPFNASGLLQKDLNAGIYLDKVTLKRPDPSQLPKRPILGLPLISGSGDTGRGFGIVVLGKQSTPRPAVQSNSNCPASDRGVKR